MKCTVQAKLKGNSLRENTATSTEAKNYYPTYKKFLQINNKKNKYPNEKDNNPVGK